MRLTTAIILCLSFLTACSGGSSSGNVNGSLPNSIGSPAPITDPSEVEFTDFFDFNAQLKIKVPQTWQGTRRPNEPNLLISFSEPLSGPDDRFEETLLIVRLPTGEDLTDQGEDQSVRDEVIIEHSQRNIGVFLADELIYDATLEELPDYELRFMETSFEFNGHLYGVLYAGARADFQRNIEVVRAIANSVQLGQPVLQEVQTDIYSMSNPALVSDGENTLAVACKYDSISDSLDLVGRLVAPDRSMSEELLIHANLGSRVTNCGRTKISTSFNNNNFFVSYSATIDGVRNVVAKRLTASGAVLDSDPIVISRNSTEDVGMGAHAFDGNRYLFVWHRIDSSNADSMEAVFVSVLGEVGESFVIEASPENLNQTDDLALDLAPELEFLSDRYLLVWNPLIVPQDTNGAVFNFSPDFSIRGKLIGLDGSLLRPSPIQISTSSGQYLTRPDVSQDETGYVVSWIRNELTTFPAAELVNSSVVARRFSLAGDAIDEAPVVIADFDSFHSSNSEKRDPHIYFEQGRYRFSWVDNQYVLTNSSNTDFSEFGTTERVGVEGVTRSNGNIASWAGSPNMIRVGQRLISGWINSDDELVFWYLE